jgi:hypothetical protein
VSSVERAGVRSRSSSARPCPHRDSRRRRRTASCRRRSRTWCATPRVPPPTSRSRCSRASSSSASRTSRHGCPGARRARRRPRPRGHRRACGAARGHAEYGERPGGGYRVLATLPLGSDGGTT